MDTYSVGRQATILVGKAQNLALRIGIDDNLTAFLLLAIGAGLVVHTVRRRKRKSVHVDPVGSTWLQKEGIQ